MLPSYRAEPQPPLGLADGLGTAFPPAAQQFPGSFRARRIHRPRQRDAYMVLSTIWWLPLAVILLAPIGAFRVGYEATEAAAKK